MKMVLVPRYVTLKKKKLWKVMMLKYCSKSSWYVLDKDI